MNTPPDMPSGLTIFAIGVVIMTMFVLLLWAVNELPKKLRALMSRSGGGGGDSPAAPVSIPVSDTSIKPAPAPAAAPDIDAVNTGMPRVSRDITPDELVVLLAVLRGPDGKHRYTANAIFTLVGGNRNAVMETIRDVRSGPPAPVYRPLGDDKRPILT